MRRLFRAMRQGTERGLPESIELFLRDEFGTLFSVSLEKVRHVCRSGMSSDSVPWMRLLESLELDHACRAVDVGACVGQGSIFLAKWHEEVVAIEPTSENFATLQDTISLNGVRNVKIVRCALSSEIGTAEMHLLESRGHHSLGAVSTSGKVGVERVEVSTVDGVIAGPIDLLKVDVEGFEMEVLRGSSRALQLGIPIIVLEVSVGPSADLGRNPWEAVDYLTTLGYECVRADGKPLKAPVQHVDVVAFRDSRLAERAKRLLAQCG